MITAAGVLRYTPRISPTRSIPRCARRLWPFALYAWALLREFRATLIALAIVELLGAALYLIAPADVLDGRPANILRALYATWMAMFAQPVGSPAECWYITVLAAAYPLVGFIIFGEGVVRLAMLMISRRHGEKEWTLVMASTYRDHVVLCGLGHLGYRILQQLVQAGVPVIAIEKDADGRFLAQAKETGAPILIRDMKEDQALLDAGIMHARSIIIATNDDLANLEVALDAQRMSPQIRILLRMFDQQIAAKISGAMHIDMAFSASSLAAPVVAAMSQRTQILGSYPIAGTQFVTAQLTIAPGSHLAGHSMAEIEEHHDAHVLAHNPSGPNPSAPSPSTVLAPGDTLILHIPADRLTALSAASQHAAA